MLIISNLSIFIKSFEILIISSVKFIFAAPVSFLSGFGYMQTIIITALGGIAGVFFFYYLGGWLFKRKKATNLFSEIRKKDKTNIFNIERKLVEKIRVKYGLLGIIILTPVFLSIPLGAILANRYYSSKKRIPLYLVLSVICWSFIMTTFFSFLR